MILPFNAIINGTFYKSGAEITLPHSHCEKSVAETSEAQEPEKTYTRTEINRLKTEELQAIAVKEGLDSTLSGMALKRLLIEKYGL